jgi:SAM-dependent methyltransferase
MNTMIEIPAESPQTLAADAGRYWSSSADRPWVRDMSHWRGQGRWADDAVWLQIGQAHVQMVEAFRRQSDRHHPFRRMLEWGSGGGANLLAFAPWVETYYGVDISPPNLAECARQAAGAGFGGWKPIHIDASHPAKVLERVDAPLDFILSTAVFQHFPSQSYGLEVLSILHQLLAPGGMAIVQTRYDDGSEELGCKDRDYQRNVITFTSYTIADFWHACGCAGFRPASVVLHPEPCYAYYWLCKD